LANPNNTAGFANWQVQVSLHEPGAGIQSQTLNAKLKIENLQSEAFN